MVIAQLLQVLPPANTTTLVLLSLRVGMGILGVRCQDGLGLAGLVHVRSMDGVEGARGPVAKSGTLA